MADILSLSGLEVHAGSVKLVHGVDLQVRAGEVCALVGASGSGKSLSAKAMLGLVELEPGVTRGTLEVSVDGVVHEPVMTGDTRARRRAFEPLRGSVIGYMPQDAGQALDPIRRVGAQVGFTASLAGHDSDPLPWLVRAGLPPQVATRYPHELSGGMAQRVLLAQSLARGSRFLLADEPTTGLDPSVRRPLLGELQALARSGVGVLWITHDLRATRGIASRVLVMASGRIVESTTPEVLDSGKVSSPAAQQLVDATRRIATGTLR